MIILANCNESKYLLSINAKKDEEQKKTNLVLFGFIAEQG